MKIFRHWNILHVLFISMLLVFLNIHISPANIIDPELEQLLLSSAPDDELPVIVTLSDKADLSQIKDKNKGILRSKIIKSLKSKADSTQGPLKSFLNSKGVKRTTSFWIFNGMAVKAQKDVINELANQPGIESIRIDETLEVPVTGYGSTTVTGWNLNYVRAPELWNLGYTGAGIIVANMDTGVDVNHPDLSSKWRGGSNSWYDPNGEHSTPYDSDGHGTQTMGIIVGGDNSGTAIGVAPDALWIAVKIFNDAGQSSSSLIHQGFQWLLDPDNNPDTDDAADVINNSWGLKNYVNKCITEFQDVINSLRAAEIAVVFSAGNEGPNPYTSVSPGNYPESFAAGAIDDNHTIASFSSRGPSACDGSIYPEVVAPGVNITTTDITFGGIFPNSYTTVSGTSFSAPHVSGVMALLMSASPDYTVSELESALKQSALDLGPVGPDNDYGYGLIDVMEAFNLMNGSPTCTDADGDGYYAEAICGSQDCNDYDPTSYPGAPEIKHDGIDQDCNGYDLTIDILNAIYITKKDALAVEATSNLGQKANLLLTGYGPMKWDRKKLRWIIVVNRVGGNPGIVTVSGVEGSESASTSVK
jgi:bacillopeptidase F